MARRGENIYKRKDGRYEGRYIKYYDLAGKAVYGYIYAKSYSEIKEKLQVYKSAPKNDVKGADTKLCDWLTSWQKTQCTLKPTTLRIYNSHINNHINPAIGNVPLKKLTKEIIQNFINGLRLSPATVKTVFSTLKSALYEAGEKGFINDICSKIKLPKKEKNTSRILTVTEQGKLEKVLVKKEDIGILICLYTGLRIGEVCALKWSDINFETLILTVNGTQARIGKAVEIISPKSKSSKREIPIPLFLSEKIKQVFHKGEFVMSKYGKPVDVRTYRRYFKTVLERAGLPDMKYHSLRHTFATRALEVGMDYKTLSEILGHSSTAITLDLYAHSLKEHKKNEMNKLEGIFNS